MAHIGPLIARRIQNWGLDFARSAWHNPELITEEIMEGYTRPLQVDNWDRALWFLTSSSRDLQLDTRLDELKLPVLVITGDDDRPDAPAQNAWGAAAANAVGRPDGAPIGDPLASMP